jgi:hypothetical protein
MKNECVLPPVRWETSLNHIIEEEELFELLESQSDFMEYIAQNNLKFKSLKMLTIDYSEEFEKGRMFTFESIVKMFIDDTDPVWHKQRSSLLEPNLRSIMILIDRQQKVMYLILFGEKIGGPAEDVQSNQAESQIFNLEGDRRSEDYRRSTKVSNDILSVAEEAKRNVDKKISDRGLGSIP